MQCVIICAGMGTRMRPLTDSIAKPLIEVCGKPVLDHIVEALPPEIDELVLVVGYKKEQIQEHCGEEFHGRPVRYVEQADCTAGTGDALLCAKDLVEGKFLFMYADDIHGKDALAKVVKEEHAILAMRSETPERFGVLVLNEDGTLKEIIEKPEEPPSNLVNVGGFVLNMSVFSYYDFVEKEDDTYLVKVIDMYAQDNPMKVIEQDLWLPIGYPEHIEEAEARLCPKEN